MPKFLDVPQWYTAQNTLVKGIGSSADMFSGAILVGGPNNNATWYSGASFYYYIFTYCYRIATTTDISFSTSILFNGNYNSSGIRDTASLSVFLSQQGYNSSEKFISASGNIKISPSTDMTVYGVYGTEVGTLVGVCRNNDSGINTSYTEFSRWETNATVTVKSVFLRAAEM